jgi:hypothetical protein
MQQDITKPDSADPKHSPEYNNRLLRNHAQHVHILLFINPVGATRRVALTDTSSTLQPNSLGPIIGQIKSNTTKRIRKLPDMESIPVWQRNYFDHIIRNEKSLNRHRQYILDNPQRWEDHQDEPFNPDCTHSTHRRR